METDILISTIRDSGEVSGRGEHLPSLFEIILVDQIDAMLKPAFHHGIVALHDSLPLSLQAVASLLRARWEDLYNMVIIVLQWLFIRKRNATIAESIYGLTRRGVGGGDLALDGAGRASVSSSSPMLRWQQDMGIWFVAVLPRLVDSLKRACKDIRAYSRQQRRAQAAQDAAEAEAEGAGAAGAAARGSMDTGSVAEGREGGSLWSVQLLNRHVTRGLRGVSSAATSAINLVGEATAQVFPYAAAGAQLWVVAQKMRYLFGHTAYAHPFFAMIGIALVRRDPRKHDGALSESSGVPAPASPSSPTQRQVTLLADGGRRDATNWQLATLVAALLSIRGVQWLMQRQEQFSGTGRRARAAAAAASGAGAGERVLVDVPPPPPRPALRPCGTGAVAVPEDGSCPLCRHEPRSPAVSTGGFVFCYQCLLLSIRAEEGRAQPPACPVTGIPCKEADIILVH